VLEFDTNSSLDPELGAKIRTFRALVSDGPVAVALDDAMAGHRALRPGVWHALACEAYGAHAFASGEHEVAGRVLAEGRQEARIFDAHTVELLCEAQLALVARATGDTAGFLQLGSDAGRRVREHGLERWPTMMIVTGVSALVETLQGDPVKAHQDLLLTRQNMTMLEGVGSWAQVQSRLAMAEACLLLGDRVGANTLLKEAARLMAEKPDACWAHVQLAELEDRLATIQSLPSLGPSSLSTAELRVLHYLPTNLTIGEIGERLFVSRHTTKSHVAAIYRKLGTSSRRDTVETGRSAGLLPPA
jgi:LuxR family maltose regulon positive regulatory protein